MATKKKAIVKKGAGSMVVDNRPDYLSEGSRGQEGVGTDDLTIPRLSIIQDLSPQRKRNDPQYIDGADSGMLFNSVTEELYGDSVMFVPVIYRKEWVIWKAQAAGGGFCGAFGSEAEARAEFNSQGYGEETYKKDGTDLPAYEINDTGQQFGMIIHDDGSTEDIVMSMSKSKRKTDRQFNSLVKMGGGDRFSRIYKISAESAQNKAGQDFFNFGVRALGFVTEEIYRKGEAMYEAVSSGSVDVNRKPDGKVVEEGTTEY